MEMLFPISEWISAVNHPSINLSFKMMINEPVTCIHSFDYLLDHFNFLKNVIYPYCKTKYFIFETKYSS